MDVYTPARRPAMPGEPPDRAGSGSAPGQPRLPPSGWACGVSARMLHARHMAPSPSGISGSPAACRQGRGWGRSREAPAAAAAASGGGRRRRQEGPQLGASGRRLARPSHAPCAPGSGPAETAAAGRALAGSPTAPASGGTRRSGALGRPCSRCCAGCGALAAARRAWGSWALAGSGSGRLRSDLGRESSRQQGAEVLGSHPLSVPCQQGQSTLCGPPATLLYHCTARSHHSRALETAMEA